MLKILGQGCAGLLGFLGLIVTAIWVFVPESKCGEVGYLPKLTPACRAARSVANGDSYCSAEELKDIKCAEATYAYHKAEERKQSEEFLRTRTY